MKKTLILTLAAFMTFSLSSLDANAAETTETSTLTQKKKPLHHLEQKHFMNGIKKLIIALTVLKN